MFIRKTKTNNSATGECYFTYRLVRGERVGTKVRQITVLNLGRNFSVKPETWPLLCSRIEQMLRPSQILFDIPCPEQIESVAQRYVKQIVARALPSEETSDHIITKTETDFTPDSASIAPAIASSTHVPPSVSPTVSSSASPEHVNSTISPDFYEADINSIQLTQPRSVGVEHLALHALSQLGFVDKLTELGINGVMRASIMGNIIGRIAHPASELATWKWLETSSALDELLDIDFTSLSHMRLYRASDLLMKHRTAIEDHVFNAARTLFSLEETVTLFDLTNTYFEGAAAANPKAQRGRSKEKRSDCPLVTLGMVLDGSGFVRRSKTFAGNVFEGTTLEDMLTGLNASTGAMVIMDAGIASEANLTWLTEHKYRYLVVRRGGVRQCVAPDATNTVCIETAGGETVRLQKEVASDGKEHLLYCHSVGREVKETAMITRTMNAFEAGLQKIADGLKKSRSEKRCDKLLERIGRLKEKSRGASQHYSVTLVPDETGKLAASLTWEKSLVAGTMATHPGVYCLHTNELSWDEETLWRTYTMLTDLESVFRSLKSELGLRPVFHSKEDRSDGHLFITVLAYQCVQILRTTLRRAGIHGSWASLREICSVQRRVTTSFRSRDGQTVHVRKSTEPEAQLKAIYRAVGVNLLPGGTRKLIQ